MIRRLKILTVLLLTAVTMPLGAQVTNRAVQTTALEAFHLPAALTDMSLLDGQLRMVSDGMIFAVDENGGQLSSPIIDNDLAAIDMHLEYVVRHPVDSTLYYTKRDSKGRSQLYEYYERKPGKMDTRRLKLSGFSYSIEHPVISADGHALVFASDCPLGFGGRDLWYSEFIDGKWQYPRNMGSGINSEGDEQLPALWGDFLIFSSDGRPDRRGGYDLYATRLVALEQQGDTVMMYPIGRSQVQSLEAPFCSASDDLFFACDAGANTAWWVVRDSVSGDRFFCSKGTMACVNLKGRVLNLDGQVVANAVVSAEQGSFSQTVRTDKGGRYSLFLQPFASVTVRVAAPDYFRAEHTLATLRSSENDLYATQFFHITLESFRLGHPYRYDDLYRSSVASELSPAGRKHLDRIARFMVENPHLKLTLAAFYNQSADIPFCVLLNQSRLRALRAYLEEKGVASDAILTSMNPPTGIEPIEEEQRSSPVSVSSLMVAFTFSK